MAKKQNFLSVFLNGLIFENPTFVLMLGMCPTLAQTTKVINAIGLGLATAVVIVCSNIFISLLRNFISEKVRIPSFIVIIATFVTIVHLLMKAYLPDLAASIGSFIPLIVVNCIVFARAESFAYKNPLVPSIADGLGMGLGFTMSISILALIRELLGAGSILGFRVMPEAFQPFGIMQEVPGGFITLGFLLILVNLLRNKLQKKTVKKEAEA